MLEFISLVNIEVRTCMLNFSQRCGEPLKTKVRTPERLNLNKCASSDDHILLHISDITTKFFGFLFFLYKVPDDEMQRQLLLRTKDLISVHN